MIVQYCHNDELSFGCRCLFTLNSTTVSLCHTTVFRQYQKGVISGTVASQCDVFKCAMSIALQTMD